MSSITPIGQPEAAGETVVVYGTVNRDLYLYGVAVADGSIRWQQPASPGEVVTGIPVTPNVVDGRVAYFRPEPAAGLLARLVIAAPDTGRDLLVSGPSLFHSRPSGCPDGKDVCLVTTDGDGTRITRRFSVEAGGPVPDRGLPPPDSRIIGEGLLDLGGREPEVLAGFKDGAIQWRSPLTRYFPEGYTTDEGWRFALYPSTGLHVGSVDHVPVREDASVVVRDLSMAETAAIDAATGASAWRSEGTSFTCGSGIDVEQPGGADESQPWPVRCRYRGTARYDRATDAPSYEGLDVTVEGFDVRTGTTTWSLPLGAAEGLLADETEATVVSDSEVVIRAATGPLVVDLANGATHAPARGEAFWCQKGAMLKYRETLYINHDLSSDTWRGGTLLYPCTAGGAPTTSTPRQLASSLGASVGKRTVVATAGGLVAYDRRGT